MISMPQIQSIRSRRRNGESIASIARSERVGEPTVRKYLRVDGLSARPPVRRRRGSVIDEWLPMIGGMLAEDREAWRKQRHTATRIHERLRDGYGAGVSLSTVTRTVARLRREAAAEREAGFLDLSWHPGECRADFGQVDVRYRGVVTRMRHFVLDFPYSNIGPSRLMPGENAECTCQALRNLFEWLGGVPERIVYDNAAGVGRKWFDGIRLTRLFQAFQAHYGFEYAFCNPYSGHEKGGVEARVGAVRRRLFVPVPGVWNLDSFNLRLPGRRLGLGDKDHYRKGESQTGLFDEDRKALPPLPAKPFDVVTWTRMKADKYGNITVQGRHRYAAGPEHAGHEMIVGLRALEGGDPRCRRQTRDHASEVLRGQADRQRRPVEPARAVARPAGGLAQQPGARRDARPASRMDRRAGRGHAARRPACPAARRRRERLAGGRGRHAR